VQRIVDAQWEKMTKMNWVAVAYSTTGPVAPVLFETSLRLEAQSEQLRLSEDLSPPNFVREVPRNTLDRNCVIKA
jgi:hypothetical protein